MIQNKDTTNRAFMQVDDVHDLFSLFLWMYPTASCTKQSPPAKQRGIGMIV